MTDSPGQIDFNPSPTSADAAQLGAPDPDSLLSPTASTPGPESDKKAVIYDGGFASAKETGVLLRIGSGGAGQIGLIRVLADAFIQDWAAKGNSPFQVAWYLGDTTDSINYLADGTIDIAVTYNKAAEEAALISGVATERVYAFRDHFLLVGPPENPANLLSSDTVSMMFHKIATAGNRDAVKPLYPIPTRFLSRFDKSGTNIKESELFITVGQVPWAHTYSRWYHTLPLFPRNALAAAAILSEYTLTDLSTWITSPTSVRSELEIFNRGLDDDPNDPLLNAGHALYGARASPAHAVIGRAFMVWLASPDGGQAVIRSFSIDGQVVVTEAPQDSHKIQGLPSPAETTV